MDTHLDSLTLVVVLALGNLALAAALFCHGVDSRAQGRGAALAPLALAKLCQGAGWLLMCMIGVVPLLLHGPAADLLLFAGVALDAAALWKAAGRPRWRRVLLPLLAVLSAGWLVCFATAYGALRVPAGSAIMAVFFLAGAAALARGWRTAGLLRRCLAAATVVLALAVVAHGLRVLPLPFSWGLVAFYLIMLVNGVGYLLLERDRLQQQLDRLDVVDALTDVPNRRGFYQALAPWLALARRPGQPTALIVVNLDQFKRINDHYGHQVGDQVLQALVGTCRSQLRDSDLMGRLGGAEFAIQLPRTTLADALTVAERIRLAVAALPVKAERAVIELTASLGVTTIRADDSTVSLFKRADEALQAAKLAGRNRVAAAAPPAAAGETGS